MIVDRLQTAELKIFWLQDVDVPDTMRDMQATFSGIFGENKNKNWKGDKRNAITQFS